MRFKIILLFGIILVLLVMVVSTNKKVYGSSGFIYSCVHNNYDYEHATLIEPTCCSWGKIIYPCKEPGCPGTAVYRWAQPRPHYFGLRGSVTVHEPTCTEKGYTHLHCFWCGLDRYEDDVPALGHQLDKYDREPTCTEEGIHFDGCTREGCPLQYVNERIPKIDHDLQKYDFPATCIEERIYLSKMHNVWRRIRRLKKNTSY